MIVMCLCLVILISLIPFSLSEIDYNCGHGEEGHKVGLQCTANGNATKSFVWQVMENGTYVNKTKCLVNGTCFSYDTECSSNLSGNNFIINIVLNRNRILWRCIWDDVNTNISPCLITVYIPPMKPTCDPPMFTVSNTAVNVTCRTDRVYPSAQCRFIPYAGFGILSAHTSYKDLLTLENYVYRIEEISSLSGLQSIEGFTNLNVTLLPIKNFTSPINSQDYKTECSFFYYIPSLTQPTVYRFAVGMYVVNQSTEVISDIIELALSYPESQLDNCSTEYIESSTRAKCTCKLTNAGVPPGKAYWTSTNSDKFSTIPKNESSLIEVAFNPSATNATFYCRSKSTVLELNHVEIFQPRFAYGPSNVFMTANPSSVQFTATTSAMITCRVPTDQVAPGVNFYYVLPQDNKKLINSTQNDGFNYIATFTFLIPSPGIFRLKCEVHNSNFPTMFTEGTLSLESYGGVGSVKFDDVFTVVFDLCTATIPVSCTVTLSQVYPGSVSQMFINDDLKSNKTSMESEFTYTLTYNFPVTSSGTFTVTCSAVNTETRKVMVTDIITFTVKDSTCSVNTLPIILGLTLGGAALLLLLIVGFICWKRRRNAARRQNTERVLFTVGDRQVQVIVTRNGQVQNNGNYSIFPEPPPDYVSPIDYVRSPSWSDSMKTDYTELSYNRSSNNTDYEERIYSDPEEYITLTDEK